MFEQELTVFTDKKFTGKFELIRELAQLVAGKVTSPDAYLEAVKERELTLSTYVEYGVAIPHAKTEAVKTPFVIYVKLDEGVTWGDDGEVAKYVFLIGVPSKMAENLHLKILSELSKDLLRENFRNNLFGAETTEEAFKILKEMEKEIVK